jgi:homoserine O-succinyltransferase
MDFEDVDYWPELCEIMDWSAANVTSTLHICWGAQAGMYRHYGIGKVLLPAKLSGVYPHAVLNGRKIIVRGFDNTFLAPHSRRTSVDETALEKCGQLEKLAASPIAGTHLVTSQKGKQVFVFGHMEYDADTLAREYFRDAANGDKPQIPYNYFPDGDPEKTPVTTWKAHANLLFSNWLNYHVYQSTPYDISQIQP